MGPSLYWSNMEASLRSSWPFLLLLLSSVACQNVDVKNSLDYGNWHRSLSCLVDVDVDDDDPEVESCLLTAPNGETFGTAENCSFVYSLLKANASATYNGYWTCDVKVKGLEMDLSAQRLVTKNYGDESFFIDDVEYRLPETFLPDSYDILIIPQAHENSFEGETTAHMVAQEPGNTVTLHAKSLTFHDLGTLRVQVGERSVEVTKMAFDLEKSQVTLHLSEEYQDGDLVAVTLSYEGQFGDRRGLYKTIERPPGGGTRDFFMTQHEPVDARRTFPCLDEPQYKANFSVRVGRLPDYSSISNTPQVSSGEQEVPGWPGFVLDEYEQTPPMATYLVEVVVSQYVARESEESSYGQKFRIWSSPEDYNLTKYAAEVAPQIYDNFVEMFGEKDAMVKEDLIAVPVMEAAAMENWGAMTFRSRSLLQDDSVTLDTDVPLAIAHELAHIWFGNLITAKHWSNIYLNEAFASHFGFYGGQLVAPESKLDQLEFFYHTVIQTFGEDEADGLGPIVTTAETEDQIDAVFSENTYGKGGAIVKMMKLAMGEDKFLRAIQSYEKENRFGSTLESDLLAAFDRVFVMPAVSAVPDVTATRENHTLTLSKTTASNASQQLHNATFAEVMTDWTHQGGYPTILVNRGMGDDSNLVTVEQLLEHDEQTVQNKGWWIPISYTWVGGDFSETHARFWLDPTTAGKPVTFELEPEVPADAALVFNVEAMGYYRTMYDEVNLNRLMAAVKADPTSIPVMSFLQIKWDLENAPPGTQEAKYYKKFKLIQVPGELQSPYW